MRYFFIIVLLSVVFCTASTALASTYIDVSAASVDEGALRKVWEEDGKRQIGCMGDSEFLISVSESSPYDIASCWIYVDGTTTSGTTRTLTATAYRILHGAVVIKYSNDTYECAEFRVLPAWELNDPNLPDAGSIAPTIFELPADITAATLIAGVASGEQDGPTTRTDHLGCRNESCESFVNLEKDKCKTDLDCVDEW